MPPLRLTIALTMFLLPAAKAATTTGGDVPVELVGTWSQSSYLNNGAGTDGRRTCFTLRPNGTYPHGGESSSSGQNGHS